MYTCVYIYIYIYIYIHTSLCVILLLLLALALSLSLLLVVVVAAVVVYYYYISSFIVITPCPDRARGQETAPPSRRPAALDWLRTNGVDTNGAAAKVMNFDRLGKEVRPGTLGKIEVG